MMQVMEIIDGNWIRKRLANRRGEEKRLADALGIPPATLSKIISGGRKLRVDEVPKVLTFFGLGEDAALRQLRALWPGLTPQEQDFLLTSAHAMHARRQAGDG